MKSHELTKPGFYWYVSDCADDAPEIVCVDKHEYEDVDGITQTWFEVFGSRSEVGSHWLGCDWYGDFVGPITPPSAFDGDTDHG